MKCLIVSFLLSFCSNLVFAQTKQREINVIGLDSSASYYFIVFSEGKEKGVIASPKQVDLTKAHSGVPIKLNHTYRLYLSSIKSVPHMEQTKSNSKMGPDSVKTLTFICTKPAGMVYYIKGKKAPLYVSDDISGVKISETSLYSK